MNEMNDYHSTSCVYTQYAYSVMQGKRVLETRLACRAWHVMVADSNLGGSWFGRFYSLPAPLLCQRLLAPPKIRLGRLTLPPTRILEDLNEHHDYLVRLFSIVWLGFLPTELSRHA